MEDKRKKVEEKKNILRIDPEATIQIKRGLQANLPTTGLNPGEFLLATDTGNLYICITETQKKLIASNSQLGNYLEKSKNLLDVPNKDLARKHLNVYSKPQVDALLTGIAWKEPVKAVSTTNRTVSGLGSVDGIALAENDRVLLVGQTDAKQNGIYRVLSGAWTRSQDANTPAELKNAAVFVSQGNEYADTAWVCTSDSISIGSTPLNFIQFAGASTYQAGDGISLDGNTFSFDITDFEVDNNVGQFDRLLVEGTAIGGGVKRATIKEVVQNSGVEFDSYKAKVTSQGTAGFLSEKIEGGENMIGMAKGIHVVSNNDKVQIGFVINFLPEYTGGTGAADADVKGLVFCTMNQNQRVSINDLLKHAKIDGGTF